MNLGITGVTDADFDIIDGTATYAGGKLTLPTGVTEADFTIEAQDNNRSGADKTLTLTLTGLSGGPDGWAPDQTGSEIPSGVPNSRSITIEDDDKNTIGFARESGEPLRIAVGEDAGTITTLMLQLSNPDGTAYTDNIPADLAMQYTLSGTNGDDFSFEAELDGTGTKTALLSTGTLEIPTGQSLANGQVPITVTVKEDEVPENVEEFVYTIEADPSRFPKGSWEIDSAADSFTLVVTDNDNSISIPGHNTIYNPAILEESAENLEIPVTLNAYAGAKHHLQRQGDGDRLERPGSSRRERCPLRTRSRLQGRRCGRGCFGARSPADSEPCHHPDTRPHCREQGGIQVHSEVGISSASRFCVSQSFYSRCSSRR